MFGYDSLQIDFLADYQWLIWLALLALIGLSVWLYLRTNPPVRPVVKGILVALRLIAVLALIAVLFEPVISYSRGLSRKPKVALLTDRSASMARIEEGKSREARIDSLIKSSVFGPLDDQTELIRFQFADGLRSVEDSFNTDATALGNSLDQLKRQLLPEPADYWLVLTDGNSNQGVDPLSIARELNQPVYVVDAALAPAQFDAGIEAVDHNSVLFAGQKAEIKVKLGWRQAGDKNINLRLTDGDNLLDDQRIKTEQKDGFGEVDLTFTPEEPGRQMLTVRLRAEGDQDDGNNSRTISVKVLKSRLSVLLVSQKPDYELSFLKRFLDRASKYDVDLRVLNPSAENLSGQFPSRQADLNRYDLVIFHDVDPRLYSGQNEIIHSFLQDKGGGIWILGGENMAAAATPVWLGQLMPFYQSRRLGVEYQEFHGEPDEDNLFHPILRIADSRGGIRQAWGELPPFQMLAPSDQVDPNGTVLLTAPGWRGTVERMPVIGFKRTGPGKLVYTAAGPFWKWDFYSTGYGGDEKKYSLFVEGLISWLTIPEDYDPIRVAPTKDIFTRGEEISFDGIAFDQGYRAINEVTGTVRLSNDSTKESFETDLLEVKEGTYAGTLKGVPSGGYHYTGRLEKDGKLLKESTGRIMVEKYSIEEMEQGGNPEMLKQLADRTGGGYARIDKFNELLAKLDLEPVETEQTGEASIWDNYWLLVIFISMLGLEWGIRKFNHLL